MPRNSSRIKLLQCEVCGSDEIEVDKVCRMYLASSHYGSDEYRCLACGRRWEVAYLITKSEVISPGNHPEKGKKR